MALTNAFYEAVQSGNVRRVRIMMQDSLLVDPTFSEFNAMEKVAAAMTGLYDKHDGKHSQIVSLNVLLENSLKTKILILISFIMTVIAL